MPFGKPAPEKPVAKKAAAPVATVQKKGFKPVTAAPPAKAGFGAKKAAAPASKIASASKSAPAERKRTEDSDEVDLGGVTTGWGGAAAMRAEHSDYANRLSMKDGEVLVIRFLDNAPYANVSTHWFKRQGQRSFQCPGVKSCPICAVGDKPRITHNFNVLVLTDGDPILHSWEVGKRLLDDIKKAADNARYKPLNSRFYTLEREGSGMNDTKYKLNVVKRTSDIADDHPTLHVPDDDEVEGSERYTEQDAAKQRSPLATLQEMAEELTGGGYDPDADDDD